MTLLVRHLGRADYVETWHAMRDFTARRDADTPDELWFVEHNPVYTLGQAGRAGHVRDPGPVPVIRVDRGGQVTYHGPGQVVAYVLLDLTRRGYGVKELVQRLEQAVIDLSAAYGVTGERRAGAPGVYVAGAKLAALGLRVRHGCSYHGLALNVAMDLTPFSSIDPCGYPGMVVTQLADLGVPDTPDAVADNLKEVLRGVLT